MVGNAPNLTLASGTNIKSSVTVLGRCLPSFISEALDKAQDLVATVGSANDTEIRDASNSTVSIQDIFDGSG